MQEVGLYKHLISPYHFLEETLRYRLQLHRVLVLVKNTIWNLGLSLSGVVDGNEVLTISPVAHAVFNTYGFAATSAQSNNTVNLIFTNSVPTDIALSSSSISEKCCPQVQTIGALSSTDADTGDIHTYSLISGTGDTDNGSFTVSGTKPTPLLQP